MRAVFWDENLWFGDDGQRKAIAEMGNLQFAETDTLTAAKVREILRQRAEKLAQVPPQERGGDVLELVVARLGQERYGIELGAVERIEPVHRLTPIPGIPSFWTGIVNLRGRLYPVLDLGKFLALADAGGNGSPAQAAAERGLIFVQGNGLHVCLLVDEILAVETVLLSDVGSGLQSSNAAASEFVSGNTREMVGILDVQKLLADPRLVVKDR